MSLGDPDQNIPDKTSCTAYSLLFSVFMIISVFILPAALWLWLAFDEPMEKRTVIIHGLIFVFIITFSLILFVLDRFLPSLRLKKNDARPLFCLTALGTLVSSFVISSTSGGGTIWFSIHFGFPIPFFRLIVSGEFSPPTSISAPPPWPYVYIYTFQFILKNILLYPDAFTFNWISVLFILINIYFCIHISHILITFFKLLLLAKKR